MTPTIILLVITALFAWKLMAASTPEELESRIAQLESELDQLKEKISALESEYHFEAPILVDASDQIIGTVVRELDNKIQVLSSQGYSFTLDRNGAIMPKIISYATPTCTGEKYVAWQAQNILPAGSEGNAVPGEVFSAGGNNLTASDELFYIPFNSKETKISQSYFLTPTSCSFGGDVIAYPVSPNDSAVTDIERIDYALPLHITTPP